MQCILIKEQWERQNRKAGPPHLSWIYSTLSAWDCGECSLIYFLFQVLACLLGPLSPLQESLSLPSDPPQSRACVIGTGDNDPASASLSH